MIDSYRAELVEYINKMRKIKANKSTEPTPLIGTPRSNRPTETYVLSGMGIRVAIAEVLKRANGPMSPAEVTVKLEEHGFESDMKTDLSLRVGNELFRMARRRIIKRIGRGQYAL